MAEVVEEATHVWCHKSRLVFFFSAMRHFAQEMQERGLRVWYHSLTENAKQDQVHSLAEAVEWVSRNFKPQKIEIVGMPEQKTAITSMPLPGRLAVDIEKMPAPGRMTVDIGKMPEQPRPLRARQTVEHHPNTQEITATVTTYEYARDGDDADS